jgi:hypothetical protein
LSIKRPHSFISLTIHGPNYHCDVSKTCWKQGDDLNTLRERRIETEKIYKLSKGVISGTLLWKAARIDGMTFSRRKAIRTTRTRLPPGAGSAQTQTYLSNITLHLTALSDKTSTVNAFINRHLNTREARKQLQGVPIEIS